MIEEILPSSVAVEESHYGLAIELFPEEEEAILGAGPGRRAEFTTVRACARRAFFRLGLPESPLVPGRRGSPTWPAGVVGSMTHCTGLSAAAVAPQGVIVGLGIDAEPNAQLPDDVLEFISSEEERRALPHGGDVAWDRLLFCTKEAIYKMWFPLTHQWLDFRDASVHIDAAGTFSAKLSSDKTREFSNFERHVEGRWIADDRHIAATVVATGPR